MPLPRTRAKCCPGTSSGTPRRLCRARSPRTASDRARCCTRPGARALSIPQYGFPVIGPAENRARVSQQLDGIWEEKARARSIVVVTAGERTASELFLFALGCDNIDHEHHKYGRKQPQARSGNHTGRPHQKIRAIERMPDETIWTALNYV